MESVSRIARSPRSGPGLLEHNPPALANVDQLVSSPTNRTDEVETEAVYPRFDGAEVDQQMAPDALPHSPLHFRATRQSSIDHVPAVHRQQLAHRFLDIARTQATCSQDVRLFARNQREVSMQGKTLFMDRLISRTRDWQCRFPALSASSQIADSMSDGRQIVAATTSSTGVRCVFFSNHGSVLDFSATWDELERAKTWWYFVRRWNFWVVSTEAELRALRIAEDEPVLGVALNVAPVERGDTLRLFALLDAAERRARRFIDVIAEGKPPVAATSHAGSPRTEAA
ncbi:hypothetical protein KNO81_34300 [Paraburkholderia sediminicola]|nr:hypothetical protein [Paraburkholderia sediminicola]